MGITNTYLFYLIINITNLSHVPFQLEMTTMGESYVPPRIVVCIELVTIKCKHFNIIETSNNIILLIKAQSILHSDFYPEAVYFQGKFWISQSAISHIQN